MTTRSHSHPRFISTSAFLVASSLASGVLAAPCPTNLPNPIYGAGGSAVTNTLGAVARALASLPPDQAVTIFYNDPGACAGYAHFVAPEISQPDSFWYWPADGDPVQCEPNGDEELSFAHMGNTPALCPGGEDLPAGFGRFVAPVQTINVITHAASSEDSITAEALYHIYGFGPGAAGRSVAPWIEPADVYGRRTNSFVHQIVANLTGVPSGSFKIPEDNFLRTNDETVAAVFLKGQTNANRPLGYVSGSAADAGEGRGEVKTLAYRDFDQTCAYLPHSSRDRKDNYNTRTGQYALWTPAWFYAKTTDDGKIANPLVANLIGWFDGTLEAPGDLDVVELVIQAGDVPLCAMQAIRPDGDLSPITSYAPENPCNGYYEFVKTGQTDYVSCSDSTDCNEAEGEQCRYGFCEAY